MSNNFLDDYLLYNEGNEAHEAYHTWTALAVLSSVVSRKVWTLRTDPRESLGNYIVVMANIYACLIGEQGNRKTTAKDLGYDLLREVCPDLPVSAERQSAENIVKFMSDDAQLRTFTDPEGLPMEYHPLSVFCTEFKFFVGINPTASLEFLTTIYDRKFLDVKTQKGGTEKIVNPYLVFLACETPSWIQERLKQRVIDGGISRRIIFVYVTEEVKRISFPSVSEKSKLAFVRCREHLHKILPIVGEFKWEHDAAAFFDLWYKSMKLPDDPIMRGWYRSKDTQAIKVAMLLAAAEPEPKLLITRTHLARAIKMLTDLEPNMAKLLCSTGQNKLATAGNILLDFVDRAGGMIPLMELKKMVWNDLGGMDFSQVLNHFTETQQIYKKQLGKNGVSKDFILSKIKYNEMVASTELASVTLPKPPSSAPS